MRSPDVWEPGSEPHTPPLNMALESSPQVTITQQHVRDSRSPCIQQWHGLH